MVQVNGIRIEVQRFNNERAGRVKYSTRCPWRSDSPCDARRAMPTSLGAGSDSGSSGRIAGIFAFYSLMINPLKRGRQAGPRRAPRPSSQQNAGLTARLAILFAE